MGARAPAALGSSQRCRRGGTRGAEEVRVCRRTAHAQRVICWASFMGNEINRALKAGRRAIRPGDRERG